MLVGKGLGCCPSEFCVTSFTPFNVQHPLPTGLIRSTAPPHSASQNSLQDSPTELRVFVTCLPGLRDSDLGRTLLGLCLGRFCKPCSRGFLEVRTSDFGHLDSTLMHITTDIAHNCSLWGWYPCFPDHCNFALRCVGGHPGTVEHGVRQPPEPKYCATPSPEIPHAPYYQ